MGDSFLKETLGKFPYLEPYSQLIYMFTQKTEI